MLKKGTVMPDLKGVSRNPFTKFRTYCNKLFRIGQEVPKSDAITIGLEVNKGLSKGEAGGGAGPAQTQKYLKSQKALFTGTAAGQEAIQSKGTKTFDNGDVYVGDFENGEIHGNDTMTYNNGIVYEGDFVDGKNHGNGKVTFTDGTTQTGQFADGKMLTEDNKLSELDFWFTGDFFDEELHGEGKIVNDSGDVVAEGKFENGKLVKGSIFKPYDTTLDILNKHQEKEIVDDFKGYKGTVKDGLPHGEGIKNSEIKNNEITVSGTWDNGVLTDGTLKIKMLDGVQLFEYENGIEIRETYKPSPAKQNEIIQDAKASAFADNAYSNETEARWLEDRKQELHELDEIGFEELKNILENNSWGIQDLRNLEIKDEENLEPFTNELRDEMTNFIDDGKPASINFEEKLFILRLKMNKNTKIRKHNKLANEKRQLYNEMKKILNDETKGVEKKEASYYPL